MSHPIFTFNRYHLGDNIIFLHMLRALAKQHDQTLFVHFCNGCDFPQLREVVVDLSNIHLTDFESPLWQERQHEALDTWKNHDHFWENSRFRWDWSQFMLSHHGWTAARMGFISPFKVREHLLFDYPALEFSPYRQKYDFLVVNCEPNSGQFKPMAQHGSGYLDGLVNQLCKKGSVLVVGKGDYLRHINIHQVSPEDSISKIGAGSVQCEHIIGVATGPLWPCINVHNNHSHEGRKFIALLDNGESLNLPHWEQVGSREAVFEIAKEEGWI